MKKKMIELTVEEAKEMIKINKNVNDFTIIDFRTPEEYKLGHFDGGINIDYENANHYRELQKLDKKKRYLIYCRAGRRSGIAQELMLEMGFKEVYNVVGFPFGDYDRSKLKSLC